MKIGWLLISPDGTITFYKYDPEYYEWGSRLVKIAYAEVIDE